MFGRSPLTIFDIVSILLLLVFIPLTSHPFYSPHPLQSI